MPGPKIGGDSHDGPELESSRNLRKEETKVPGVRSNPGGVEY